MKKNVRHYQFLIKSQNLSQPSFYFIKIYLRWLTPLNNNHIYRASIVSSLILPTSFRLFTRSFLQCIFSTLQCRFFATQWLSSIQDNVTVHDLEVRLSSDSSFIDVHASSLNFGDNFKSAELMSVSTLWLKHSLHEGERYQPRAVEGGFYSISPLTHFPVGKIRHAESWFLLHLP